MFDIAFNGTDIALDDSGHLTSVDAIEEVAQRLRTRLSAQSGDWFLDITSGLPWRESIAVRKPNLTTIGALFRSEIGSTPGVLRITAFALSFNKSSGRLSLNFSVDTIYGPIQASAEGEDITALLVSLLFMPVGSIL